MQNNFKSFFSALSADWFSFIVFFFIFFIAIRFFVTWYFKLNSIESLLEDIKEILTKDKNNVV